MIVIDTSKYDMVQVVLSDNPKVLYIDKIHVDNNSTFISLYMSKEILNRFISLCQPDNLEVKNDNI